MASLTPPLPSCPHCNGAMRASPYMDGALCRCGFTIDHEDLVATRARFVGADERAAALRQAGRFTPIPQAEPGIRVGSFAELSKVSWWRRSEGLLPGTAASIDATARYSAKVHGLDVQVQEAPGVYLVVQRPGGQRENLERHAMYGLAPWGRLDECANEVVKAIAAKYGPGKLWVLQGVVCPILDDGGVSVSDVGGLPHVWLRSYYFHDPVRSAVRAPTMDEHDCLSRLTGDRVDWVCDTCKGFGFGMHRCKGPDPVAGETSVATPAGPLTFKRTAVSRDGAMQSIQAKLNETVGRINAALGHVVTLQNVSGSSAGTLTLKAGSASVPPQNRISLTTTDEDIGHAARSGIPLVASTTGQANQVWPRSFRTLPDGRVETEWSDVEVARDDVTYDSVELRKLVLWNEVACRDGRLADSMSPTRDVDARKVWRCATTLQRDAVSAYHSDRLRAKLKASAAADKARETSVVVDMEDL